MRFKLVFVCSLFLLRFQASAQVTREEVAERITERLIENLEDEADLLDLLEQSLMFLEDPLDLNTAGPQDLSQLGFLRPDQVLGILKHRNHFGNFIDVLELQVVPELDATTIQILRHFVKVGTIVMRPSDIWRLIRKSSKEIVLAGSAVHPWSKGFFNGGDSGMAVYPGSPYRRLVRVRATNGQKFSFGINAESDPGEMFQWNEQIKGFDFYSAHLMMGKTGKLEKLVIGDFQADFGQGLTIGTGFNIGKSALVLRNKKSFQGIRPYRSINENLFMRGAAAHFRFGSVDIGLFHSRRKLDAAFETPDSLEDETLAAFTAIQQSGLHRTASELASRRSLLSLSNGAHIGWSSGVQRIGFSAMHQQFEREQQAGTQPYQFYGFSGKSFIRLGTDWDFYWKNLNFYGEFSRSGENAFALNSGMLLSLGKRLDLSFLYRNYRPSFNPLWANAFSEQSRPVNEEGMYAGMHFQINKRNYILGYADHYLFPWLSFQRDGKARGKDYLLEFGHAFNRKNKMYLRFRSEEKERNYEHEGLNRLFPDHRMGLRFNYDQSSGNFRFQTRAEWSRYQNYMGITYGSLIYQDIKWKQWPIPIDAVLRLAWFNTEDWNSRIYAFERDVLYQFSVPAFSGNGFRIMTIFHMNLNKNSDLWFKWSYTAFPELTTIGSGRDQLPSNSRTDIKMQYRYKF